MNKNALRFLLPIALAVSLVSNHATANTFKNGNKLHDLCVDDASKPFGCANAGGLCRIVSRTPVV